MADRTSAAIYRTIFKRLAADPTSQHLRWARELWTESFEYDFTPCQMCCDGALLILGLARKEDGRCSYPNKDGEF